MERDERGAKVISLIEKATNSTAPEVDSRLLKAIKFVVRSSDDELRLAVETLMEKMKRDHSQVRYLALLIIDELFMRSKLFRSLLVVRFDQFLSLSVGFRRNMPLPAPPAIASRLRSKAIEFLEKWNTSFGIHYRQLRLGFDYLKNTLRFQFPNLQQNAVRIQQERIEREMRSKEILLNKFEILKENLSSIKAEIQLTIDEVGECLEILRPKEDNFIHAGPADDDEVEEFGSSALWEIRLVSLKEGEKVPESSDNKVIFDTMRELYKLIVTRHLLLVQEWLSVLVRVEPADISFRDSTLKEFIDIRNHLQSVKKKCEQSGCALVDTVDHMDENMWEEDKIESFDAGTSSSSSKPSKNLADSAFNKDKNTTPGNISDTNGKPSKNLADSVFIEDKNTTPGNISDANGKPSKNLANSAFNEDMNITPGNISDTNGSGNSPGEGDVADSTSEKRKLLAEAPVMTWGSFLDSWGSSRDVLANQRGLELEGHWGRVDYDAVIPAAKIAELSVHATTYKEEHAEIQPCLAPMRKGGLCQRRDLRVCPFHGPIIPRDAEGNPINQVPEEDDKKLELEADIVEQLAKQAVKNVRDRDKEETKKRENDRQLLKRAKLAKVREHNEAVLREAAMASTSHSEFVGDALESRVQNTPHYKEKQTLASMLCEIQNGRVGWLSGLLN